MLHAFRGTVITSAELTGADSIPDSLPLVSASLSSLLNLLTTATDGESLSKVLAA
jgi:hypothetical protein